jgi:pyruvate kinase
VRIMVTLPSEAAADYGLVRDLVINGMDCARINCAHDSLPMWQQMAVHVRRASAEVGQPCRLLVDMAGPKLRTGALPLGPSVLHWRPRRDDMAVVVRSAAGRRGCSFSRPQYVAEAIARW